MNGNLKRPRQLHSLLLSGAGWGVGILLSISPVAAQVPSTLDPARVEEGLQGRPQLQAQPPISLPGIADDAAPAQAANVTFVFRGVEIDGATAIPKGDLLDGWAHTVGDTVRVADIYALAQSVSRAYRDAGYALSFALVPQQQIKDGKFRIQVIEGFVERVDIEGDLSGPVLANAQAIADHITASRPLRTADLERYLLLINDLPGVTASAVLSPAGTTGGVGRDPYRRLSAVRCRSEL